MITSEEAIVTSDSVRNPGWTRTTLARIGNVVRGASPRPAGDPKYFNGDFIPWLTVAALTNIPGSQLTVIETAGKLTEAGAQFSRTLTPGTVIIANSGATLGVAKMLGISCCANDGIAALLDLRSDVDARYVVHHINSQTEKLRTVVATGNGQPNLNTGLIGAIEIDLPCKEEQSAIADALGSIDVLIDSLDQLLTKKCRIKQGAMQELLTGKRRLPGFSQSWMKTQLSQLGTFLKGAGIKRDQAASGDLPCVRYGEIYTEHSDCIRSFKSWISAAVASTATRLQRGDLLFAGSGETKEEIGKCVAFLEDTPAYAGGDIVILRPQTEVDSMYLGYLLNTPAAIRQKASRGQGDAVVHISAAALGQVTIDLPEPSEQAAIAEVLSDMDSDIAALESRLTKARALKQAMAQALLTGRIRLVEPAA